MANNVLAVSQENKPDRNAKNILRVLSAYPFIWTLGILLGGLVKSQAIVMITMFTWVVAFYLGTLTWLGLTIYLTATKKITAKEVLIHLLVICMGIIAAYLVSEYNILNSGVKYID